MNDWCELFNMKNYSIWNLFYTKEAFCLKSKCGFVLWNTMISATTNKYVCGNTFVELFLSPNTVEFSVGEEICSKCNISTFFFPQSCWCVQYTKYAAVSVLRLTMQITTVCQITWYFIAWYRCLKFIYDMFLRS